MHVEHEPALTWTDCAQPVGMLVLQRNGLGALRLAMRYPVGGGAPADVPIADAAQTQQLAEMLAKQFGTAIYIRDGRTARVGFTN